MIFCMTVAEPDPDADAALEDCIARIAGGDKDALADLYSRTRPAVYGFALSIVKNAHDAEDILHDACLQVWNAAGGYRRQGKPMGLGADHHPESGHQPPAGAQADGTPGSGGLAGPSGGQSRRDP